MLALLLGLTPLMLLFAVAWVAGSDTEPPG